jgi:hypothetical protein
MSEMGHSRHFGRRPTTSGIPPEADIVDRLGMSQTCRIQRGRAYASPANALNSSCGEKRTERRQMFR